MRFRTLFMVAMLTGLLWSSSRLSPAAETFRAVFVDSKENFRAEPQHLSHEKLELPEGCHVSFERLHGGKQEGVDLVVIENGAIRVRVIPTRGMGILDVWDLETNQRLFGWDSPVKEVVHPQYINLDSRGGLGWLDGFNEAMVRCGLEFAGGPGRDRFVTNTGAISEMDLTLHGKIGNIPASHVELQVNRSQPHEMRLIGRVHERMFFGPKLELATELVIQPGQKSFVLHDSVTNHAAVGQEFQLIYHSNFGSPLLEQGATLVLAADEVAPMNEHAADGIEDYGFYSAPVPGYIEKVYLVKPFADEEGTTAALLQNREKTSGALMRWSARELPWLTIWKNTNALEDGYVTGIEPGTGHSYNRRIERATGRLQTLRTGETRDFTISFEFLTSKADVDFAREQVNAIQAGRKTTVQESPPELPE